MSDQNSTEGNKVQPVAPKKKWFPKKQKSNVQKKVYKLKINVNSLDMKEGWLFFERDNGYTCPLPWDEKKWIGFPREMVESLPIFERVDPK